MSVFLKNGDTFKWKVRVCNAGPGNATNVQATLVIPAGVSVALANPTVGTYNINTKIWTIGTSVAGADCPLLELTMLVQDQSLAPYTATATVTGDQFDPIVIDNFATDLIGDVCTDVLACVNIEGEDGIVVTGTGVQGDPYLIKFLSTSITSPSWNVLTTGISANAIGIVYSAQVTGNNLELKNGNGTIIQTLALPSAFALVRYDDDAAAATGGVTIGQYYELSSTNTYSLPEGVHKTRVA